MPETPERAPFTNASIAFLQQLETNNTREWFLEQKAVYEREVRAPLQHLAESLALTMLDIDPALDVHPRHGVISRIFRDTRFSNDKSPYRINQWLAFKRKRKDWITWPAFFMEFSPLGYRYGMGYYSAAPATMQAIRNNVDANPRKYLQAMEQASSAGYSVEGEPYRRPRLPENRPGMILEFYRRKNLYCVINRPLDADFFSPALDSLLATAFRAAAPLYGLLLNAAGEA